jgi:hypothetical protein
VIGNVDCVLLEHMGDFRNIVTPSPSVAASHYRLIPSSFVLISPVTI